MGIDASIAMSVQDNLSAAVVTMKNSMTAFRNDVKELEKELYFLNNSKTNIRVDMDAAMVQLKNAKKAFRELGDEATEAERKAAEADWRQAEQNLENIRQQYDLVSRQVRQTTRDMETASGAISRAENRAGGGSGQNTRVLAALGKAGILNMAGDAAGQKRGWRTVRWGPWRGCAGCGYGKSGRSGRYRRGCSRWRWYRPADRWCSGF